MGEENKVHVFAVGDVVRLKSGGPWMVIVEMVLSTTPEIDPKKDHATCAWHTNNGQLDKHTFPVLCLERDA